MQVIPAQYKYQIIAGKNSTKHNLTAITLNFSLINKSKASFKGSMDPDFFKMLPCLPMAYWLVL